MLLGQPPLFLIVMFVRGLCVCARENVHRFYPMVYVCVCVCVCVRARKCPSILPDGVRTCVCVCVC